MDQPSGIVPEQARLFAPRREASEDETGSIERELIATLQQAGSKKERPTMPTRAGSPVPVQAVKSARQPDTHEHDSLDEAGHALIAILEKAAEVSKADYDRASILVGRLSSELRAAEIRVKELEAEALQFRDRATRAEEWLQVIAREIESKLMPPRRGGPA